MTSAQIATIKNIIDGDTLIVKTTGLSFSSRARWIDAPEVRQWFKPNTIQHANQWRWGSRSRNRLIEIIRDKELLIVEYNRDIYGRTLCDWYVDEVTLENNVQIKLVEEGLAAHFLPYNLYDFPGNDLEIYCQLIRLAALAKKNKIGFWSDPDFVLPYQYRKEGQLSG